MRDRVACILLAAGGSSRLGSAKQLIDVDGEPLVRRSTRRLIELSVGPVGVVIGASPAAVTAALCGLTIAAIANSDWRDGIGASIRAGIRWAASTGATAALIALCDQPEVRASHLRALIEATSGVDASATEYAGVVGVPAVFQARLFDRLAGLEGDRGARAILSDASLSVRRVRCEAACIDLDTADAIAHWRASRTGSGQTR